MRQLVPRTLWRRVGVVRRKFSAAARSDRNERDTDAWGLRTDGGDWPDAESRSRPDEADHLRDVPDGAGCTEIWEHLSDRNVAEADD